jgi:hypothetical protein
MHGLHLYNIRTEEKIFAWEKATASYLNLDDKALSRCIQAGTNTSAMRPRWSCRGHHKRV